MKKISIDTSCHRMPADLFTPVGVYLRLRDRFRDTVLLESTDFHSAENSWSFIGVQAIGGIEIRDRENIEFKLPGQNPQKIAIKNKAELPAMLGDFMDRFEIKAGDNPEALFAQGLYGYTAYDAVEFFDTIKLSAREQSDAIPLMRYRLYQYVIAFNHFKDELFICENRIPGIESETEALVSLIRSKDVPQYPFMVNGTEEANMLDEDFISMVKKGKASCHRGDVFQVVLSRRYRQGFTGDEFNVYRALRSINPSPYLFYFDYGDYKLFGSSPESHLVIDQGKATIHPIAGTFKRTGDEEGDRIMTEKLLKDPKENAEHVMLVDLARNDLSRHCSEVAVKHYKQVQYFSHVIHLVSEVTGNIIENIRPFELLAATFPAGTLSGAPKFRAMELIDSFEPTSRGYYGGAIGFIGFNGSCNHAIMIRTFLCSHNKLTYQAGAGIVAVSDPQTELQEVNNKLGALKKAILQAENYT